MGVLSWFLPEKDVETAKSIAQKIMAAYPPKVEPKLQFVGGKKRLGGVLESILADVDEYQRAAKMGWIRKARFGNVLQWELKEAGYSKAFFDAVSEGVVTHLMERKDGV